MNKIILILALSFLYTTVFAQGPGYLYIGKTSYYRYCILNDSSSKGVRINKIEVASPSKYTICDRRPYFATLFNVWLSNNSHDLILFSLLPSKEEGRVKWRKVNLDTLKQYIYTFKQMDSVYQKHISAFKRFKLSEDENAVPTKFESFKVIIKKVDGYYVNDGFCLTEFFRFISMNKGKLNHRRPSHIIDTTSRPLRIVDFEKRYFKLNKQYSPNFAFDNRLGAEEIPPLYYSHKDRVKGLTAFHFWTLYSWFPDILNIERGIDRFLFNPKVGIIGGDYTFYIDEIDGMYSTDCKTFSFNQYLKNAVRFMPVEITRNFR